MSKKASKPPQQAPAAMLLVDWLMRRTRLHWKPVVVIVGVVLVAGFNVGAYLVIHAKPSPAKGATTNSSSAAVGSNDHEHQATAEEQAAAAQAAQPGALVTHNISYTNEGFSATKITIKNGDTVKFNNQTKHSFQPASTDDSYPEFDPGGPVAAGDSWSFTFTKAGTWSYRDILNKKVPPATIIVE